MLLTDIPGAFTDEVGWIRELGAVTLIRTRTHGIVTERRLLMPSGVELEIGVARPLWAATEPVDVGTRTVVEGGFSVL